MDEREFLCREMTFEEEAALYKKEAMELFSREDKSCEAPPVNQLVRRGMRVIRKAREEIKLISADAVQVVRCKECKSFGVYKFSENGYCKNERGIETPKPDDFCSYGERRNDEKI